MRWPVSLPAVALARCLNAPCLLPCLQIDDVVDGKQRLTTLYQFKKGVFASGEEFRLQASVACCGVELACCMQVHDLPPTVMLDICCRASRSCRP